MANPLFDALFGRHQGSDAVFLHLADGVQITHAQFLATTARFANQLTDLGIGPGDRVAAQIAKSRQALSLYAACVQAGIVFLPLNTAYTADEVSYFVGNSGAKLLICDGKDAEALPWMAKFSRNPWPKKIVWHQDDVTHDRFYWLQLPEGSARKGQQIIATVEGQSITLTGDIPPGTRLLLHDDFINIDQPVLVTVNALPVQRFEATRSLAVIQESLARRLDPKSTPSAGITLE